MSHEKVIKAADQLRILAKDFITDDLANHPAIVAAEETGNDALLYNVASALLTVDTVLKSAINNVELMAQASSSDFKMDDLDAIASIANEFDNSKDPFLIKQAAVIDQLIMKLNTAEERLKFKKAQDTEINRLRAKLRSEDRVKDYTKTREQHDKSMKVTDAVKEIDKTFKQYRPLETALSTRTCPDHPGASQPHVLVRHRGQGALHWAGHPFESPILSDLSSGHSTR